MIDAGELQRKERKVVDIPDDVSDPQPVTAPLLLGVILDASGSMSSMVDQVISGFNEYITSNRDNPLARFVLTTLGGTVRPGRIQPITEVVPLNPQTYRPDGGTPLYDAIKVTLELMEAETADEARLVVILTDGANNQGTTSREEVRDKIEALTATTRWTFAYVGANQDAWAAARDIGVPAGNTMNYAATAGGMSASTGALRQMSQTQRNLVHDTYAATSSTIGTGSVNLRSQSGIVNCLVCGQPLPNTANEEHRCAGAPA